jgi:hypothetical protein
MHAMQYRTLGEMSGRKSMKGLISKTLHGTAGETGYPARHHAEIVYILAENSPSPQTRQGLGS